MLYNSFLIKKEEAELTPQSQNDDFTKSYCCKVDECLISRALNQGNELTQRAIKASMI